MASKGQLTGITGAFLVAAQLSARGLIASTTSRSAAGADILVTDSQCQKTYSIQVKTNGKVMQFWLLGANAPAKEPLHNLLRSIFCTPAVLEILMYINVHSGFCAPATRKLSSLATVVQRFPKGSKSHVYVFVNLVRNEAGDVSAEYYVVPSLVVDKLAVRSEHPNSVMYSINLPQISKYKDRWSLVVGS